MTCQRSLIALICIIMLSGAAIADAPRTWFADVSSPAWYQPGLGQFRGNPLYNNPSKCTGVPAGGKVWEAIHSTTDGYFVTLGDRDTINNKGWIVVGFSTPVEDNPRNPYGLDFIVFSNAYFMLDYTERLPLYADPTFRWQEPAFVEISQDMENWYLIRPNILPNDLVPSPGPDPYNPVCDTGFSSTKLRGYAEYTPSIHLPQAGTTDPFSTVTRTAQELYSVPERPSLPEGFNTVRFDYVSGGGDALDIADAVVEASPGVPAVDSGGNEIKANIGWFKYVRLTDAVAGDYYPGLGEVSAEIDTVSAIRPALSIGETKRLDAGEYALVTEAIVTAVLPDAFFVESPDRSAAVKILCDTSIPVDGKYVEVGDKMTFTGHLAKFGSAFTIPDPMWTCTSPANDLPAAVGMSAKALAGDLAYGMRVRAWGKVIDRGLGYCVINDGASSVKLTWLDISYSVPEGTAYLSATGVCDREEGGGTIVRLASPQEDITTY